MSTQGTKQEDVVEFNSLKKDDFRKIELFIQIVSDWVYETSIDLDNVPASKPKSQPEKRQSDAFL